MRTRRRREQSPGGRRAALAALGGFLLLCGLVLFLVGPGSALTGEEEEKDEPSVPQHVLKSFEAAQRAQRALESNNYGEAREHLAKTQEALATALAELDELRRGND